MLNNQIRQTRHAFSFLIGNNKKADLFTKIFLEGTDYSRAINEEDPYVITKNSLALDIMRCEKYDQATKTSDMKDEDIHYEFNDFLIQAALFHRLIDQPTGYGELSSKIKKEIVDIYTSELNNKTNQPNKIWDKIFNVSDASENIGAGANDYNNSTSAEKIILLFVGFYKDTFGNLVPPSSLSNSINDIVKYLLESPTIIYATPVLNKYLEEESKKNPSITTDFTNIYNINLKQKLMLIANQYQNQVKKIWPEGQKITVTQSTLVKNLISASNANKLINDIIDTINTGLENIIGKSLTFTTASTTEVDQLWSKFATFDENTRNIYKKFISFQEKVGSTWKDIPYEQGLSSQYANAKDKYRINLLKINGKPKFYYLIPKYIGLPVFGNLWYTDNQNNHVVARIGDDNNTHFNLLRDMYFRVFNGETNFTIDGIASFNNVPNKWSNPGPDLIFHINVDELVRERLFRLQKSMAAPSIEKAPMLSMYDKNIWMRDSNGKLYQESTAGPVYFGPNDPATINALRKDNKCYSALINTDAKTCEGYMFSCLLSDDPNSIKACLNYWQRADFNIVLQNEIKNMQPQVAIRTLQKFGFREYSDIDPISGASVRKIETVDHWLKKFVPDKYGNQVDETGANLRDLIVQNTKLLEYLQLITEYINLNPAILNDKYISTTGLLSNTSTAPRSEFAVQLKIPLRKEPSGISATTYDCSMLKSYMGTNYFSAVTRPNFMYGPSFNSPFSDNVYVDTGKGFDYTATLMGGGIGDDMININEFIKKQGTPVFSGVDSLFVIIRATLDKLKSMNKDLHLSDKSFIEKQIDSMKTISNELLKTQKYLSEYRYLLYLFQDNRPETVTINHIKNLVDKRSDLLNKQVKGENFLLQLLEILQKLITTGKSEGVEIGYKPLGEAKF